MLLTGGCQCGAVRFNAEADAPVVGVCHCAMCRRATGSAYMAEVGVPIGAVRWTGEPKVYASSPVATRGFCGECGSPLYFHYNGAPLIDLMVGTVDQAAGLMPAGQCGTESRLEGFRNLDQVRAERTGDVGSIVALWQAATGHGPPD